MASIFTKIVNGEIPSHKIAETERFLAFLDVNPLAKGHTLVIPKAEVDYLFDMDNESYAELMLFSKIVAQKIKHVIPCKKIGVAVVGLEVPHAHVHLIPINNVSDMNFANPKMKISQEELTKICESILKG